MNSGCAPYFKNTFPFHQRTKWKSCWEISSLALKWKQGWGGWMDAFTPSPEDLLLIPTLCQDVFFCERSLQFLVGVILLLLFFLHLTTTRSTQLILNVLVKISTTVLKLILKLFQQKLLRTRHLIDFPVLRLLEWHCKSISSGLYPFLGWNTLKRVNFGTTNSKFVIVKFLYLSTLPSE